GVVPALHVDRRPRAPPGAPGDALDVDDPVLCAEVAAVRRGRRRRVRALRRRLRRAPRRGPGRGPAHRGRSRAAADRHADGADAHTGAFNPLPEEWGIGSWYGETGLMLTTQFFAMKIQRYMREHGISESTLAKIAAKAFENGSRNPNAWRRTPLSEDEVLASKMVNHPLRQYMFCSPGEGAVALVLARGERARRLAHAPVFLRSVAFRTRRFGSFEVFSPSIP